jgi:NTE family protein
MTRALVLSGGGAKGAYQAGVFKALTERGHRYDLYCGISAGALNASYIAQFPSSVEDAAAIRLVRLWEEIDNPVVYKKRGLFGLMGVFASSFYKTAPLHKFVRSKVMVRRLKRTDKLLRVSAVDAHTGTTEVFTDKDDDIVEGVLASAAFPGAFEPIHVREKLMIDGGVRDMTPIRLAIDAGATEIDVIVTTPKGGVGVLPAKPKAYHIALQAIDIMSDEITEGDMTGCLLTNKLVRLGKMRERKLLNIRMIRPGSLLTDNSLDFDPKKIRAMMERGYEDGEAAA